MVSAVGSSLSSSLLQALQSKYSQTDTDSSGSLSLEEFQAGAPDEAQGVDQSELFAKLDTNSDGSLSEDEFVTGLEKAPPTPGNGGLLSGDLITQLQNLVESSDTDGDGGLNIDEFLQAAADEESTLSTEELQEAFTKFDIDGNGSVTTEEFEATLSAGAENVLAGGAAPAGGARGGGGAPPAGASDEEEDASTVYDPLDTNEDGVVSVEELMAANDDEDDQTVKRADPSQTLSFLISLQEQQGLAA